MNTEERQLLVKEYSNRLVYGVSVARNGLEGVTYGVVSGMDVGLSIVSDVLNITYYEPRNGAKYCTLETNQVMPILFPLSCLTQPITIASYNDGRSFIPIVEMAIIADCHWVIDPVLKSVDVSHEDGCYVITVNWENADSFEFSYADEDNRSLIQNYSKNDPFTIVIKERKTGYNRSVMNPLKVSEFMDKCMINYRLPAHLFVPVTETFNPYK